MNESEEKEIVPPICPRCNIAMRLRETRKFLTKTGKYRLFYGCRNWPECQSTVGAHPDGTPCGFPAIDQETKDARHRAHEVFDPLWKFGRIQREDLYRKIAIIMKIPRDKCHVAMFTKEECEKFIEACEYWKEQKYGSNGHAKRSERFRRR